MVIHATRWSVFHCGTDAHESFSPLSFEYFDRQRIAITTDKVDVQHAIDVCFARQVYPSWRLLLSMTQTMPSGPTARRLQGHHLSVITTTSPGFGATSPSSSTVSTSLLPDIARSQPEWAEFVVPVAAPPCPVTCERCLPLPPATSPRLLSPYCLC